MNVYLDDLYAFSLPDVEAAQLKIGQYLSDEDITRLRQRDDEAKAFERATRLLTNRPRSQYELETHLKKAGYTPTTIAKVIARLQQLGFVDDDSFVEWWLDNRNRFNPRGVQALRHELRQKGIAPELIDAALVEQDDERLALRAGERQASRWRHESREVFYKKMFGYLQRRGFPYRAARSATDALWEQYGEQKPDDPL